MDPEPRMGQRIRELPLQKYRNGTRLTYVTSSPPADPKGQNSQPRRQRRMWSTISTLLPPTQTSQEQHCHIPLFTHPPQVPQLMDLVKPLHCICNRTLYPPMVPLPPSTPVDNRYFSTTEYLASYRSLTTYYPEYSAAHAQYIAGNGYFDSTRTLSSLSGYDASQFNRYFEPPDNKSSVHSGSSPSSGIQGSSLSNDCKYKPPTNEFSTSSTSVTPSQTPPFTSRLR